MKKYIPRTQEEIIEEAAARAGVSPRIVKYVRNQFWQWVVYHMMHPMRCKNHIYVHGLGKFDISPKAIARSIHILGNRKRTNPYTHSLDFYWNLLHYIKKYENVRSKRFEKLNWPALYKSMQKAIDRTDPKIVHERQAKSKDNPDGYDPKKFAINVRYAKYDSINAAREYQDQREGLAETGEADNGVQSGDQTTG